MLTPTRFLAFRQHVFFKPFFLLLLLILILKIVGEYFGFFDHPPLAFDKVLHFLGGSTSGIFGVLLLSLGFWNPDNTRDHCKTNLRVWVTAVGVALVAGVVWEIAERYIPGFGNLSDLDPYDTCGDIIFDCIGGIVTGLFYQLRGL